jgi:glycerol-3-phosphate dehydrogenase
MQNYKQNRAVITSMLGWDFIVIGGGATGLGTALDAASRGFKTLLLEQADFAKGTSGRSTKLIHGGVRYLAQGNISLVYQALRERGLLLANAPHLVSKEEFIIPCYSRFSVLKYWLGLKIYDWLSGKYSFGRSRFLTRSEITEKLPGLKDKGLLGGISYFDGKFDDARLAVNMAQTGLDQGAAMLSYVKVNALLKDENGRVCGVEAQDMHDDTSHKVYARVVINATGVFVDDILRMNTPHARNLVRPSQGVHLVLDRSFLNSDQALMIPETPDKRVLFAVPWHSHLLVGTTDTPVDSTTTEPVALDEEVDFILNTASRYLKRKVERKDVLSVFAGLRPLVARVQDDRGVTKEISRDHKLIISASGLVTITGGKWTTYRKMAEETVDAAIGSAGLKVRKCRTRNLKLHGAGAAPSGSPLDIYGTDRVHIEKMLLQNPEWNVKLHPAFPNTHAEVVWAMRNEMAYTVEDILARRMRILFIDAKAAIEMCRTVAGIMASENGRGGEWVEQEVKEFELTAGKYLLKQVKTREKDH